MVAVISNIDISDAEKNLYIQHAKDRFPYRNVKSIELNFDGDMVDIAYHFGATKFQRIRRITGYLVGTTDRWNNAKSAELKDRVKHSAESEV